MIIKVINTCYFTNKMFDLLWIDYISELLFYIDEDDTLSLRITCKNMYTIFKDPRLYKLSIESHIGKGTLNLESFDTKTLITLWTDIQKKRYAEIMFLKGRNIFISGPGGTGKTHFLNLLCAKSPKYVVQTSTTGSSACALPGGQTIYSVLGLGLPKNTFFDYKTNKVLSPIEAARKKVSSLMYRGYASDNALLMALRKMEALRIDEISMLSKPTFIYFDYCLRIIRHKMSTPFGGVQLILSGDFRQFTPIPDKTGPINNKILDIQDSDKVIVLSDTWKELNLHTIDLGFSYRQFDDQEYSGILSRMRIGKLEPRDILKLKERIIKKETQIPEDCVVVYPRNDDVNRINKEKLSALNEKEDVFKPVFTVFDRGLFDELGQKESALNPYTDLILKKGCKVMLTKNISVIKGLTNGKIGIYNGCSKRHDKLKIRFHGMDYDSKIQVVNNTVKTNDGKNDIYSYGQFPITLAYAFTAHKVQGMTVDKLLAYCGKRSFGAHMLYVIFSRVRRLSDLFLFEFDSSKVEIDKSVDDYFSSNRPIKREVIVDPLEFAKRAFIFCEEKSKILNNSNTESKKVKVDPIDFNGLDHDFLKNIRAGSHNLAKTLNLNDVSPGNSATIAHSIYEKLINLEHWFDDEVIEIPQAAKNGIENEPFIIDIHKKLICDKHFKPDNYKDSVLRNLSVARPDSIFLDDSGFYIPLEVKSPNNENYKGIPVDHILQLMFEIMCTDDKNEGNETPYGDYISVVMDVETKKLVIGTDVIAVRVYRDEDTIQMIRNRLMFFYNDYIFKGISVPPNLFKGWTVHLPKIVSLNTIYKDFDTSLLSMFSL